LDAKFGLFGHFRRDFMSSPGRRTAKEAEAPSEVEDRSAATIITARAEFTGGRNAGVTRDRAAVDADGRQERWQRMRRLPRQSELAKTRSKAVYGASGEREMDFGGFRK
jgi:hypothetical protein